MKALWEYIHGYASHDRPEKVTFYDHNDNCLYRDVHIKVIGQHGWELVSVLYTQSAESGESRYEYFFKRNREDGYESGLGETAKN